MTHPVRLAMALSSLDDVSVVAQRQIDQTVQKTVETPQLQRTNRVNDGPVVQVEHIPQSHVAEKTVEIPQLYVIEKIVETPEIQTGHSIQGRIQQRTLEQIVNTPVLPVVDEQAEAPMICFRTEFNSVLENRPSNPLLFHSLRESSRHLTLGRKIRHNMS